MNAVTLDDVVARQSELNALIAQLQKQTQAAQLFTLPAFEIELQHGERYAGLVLAADGSVMHHLVLLPHKPADRLDWDDAQAWAEEAGGSLPTRQEQALLFANLRDQLERAWHWSSEQHEDDASFAWGCYFFGGGFQDGNRKSFEGCARAVRRVTA